MKPATRDNISRAKNSAKGSAARKNSRKLIRKMRSPSVGERQIFFFSPNRISIPLSPHTHLAFLISFLNVETLVLFILFDCVSSNGNKKEKKKQIHAIKCMLTMKRVCRGIFHELAGNVSPRQQTDFAYAKACNCREQFTNWI